MSFTIWMYKVHILFRLYSMSVNSFIANVIFTCKNRRLNKCFYSLLSIFILYFHVKRNNTIAHKELE